MKSKLLISLTAFALLLAACSGEQPAQPADAAPTAEPATTAPTDAAAETVEAYLTAKVAGERDTLAQLICSAQESRLDAEALSFDAVEATIEDMNCAADEGGDTVTCSGRIVAVYNGENRDFPLGTYAVVEEDGVWKWCGESAG
ncbi:MAG: hypothetical protein IAE89_14895 [Anaerolineae bacterium]|nr:hypothetical protein [Anaerolineae bacterium]